MMEDDEEKQAESDDSTPQTFWRASVNAVGASDLAEPANFQEAIMDRIKFTGGTQLKPS